MRILLMLFTLLYACQKKPHEASINFTNNHHVQLKDSILLKTIREYVNTLNLDKDSVIMSVNVSSNPLNDEMVFYIDYTQFDDFVIAPYQLPAYFTIVDSTLVTIYNNSDRYVKVEKIEKEIRKEMKRYGIHLKKWDMKIYDPPLWKVKRHGDTVLVDRPLRR